MNIQKINQLTHASLNKLTSEQYREAFNDEVTGKAFAAKVDAIENAPRPAAAPRPNGRVRTDEPAAAPAPSGFDPSFDESPAPAAAPAAAAPAPAPAQPAPAAEMPREQMSVWSYQPTDQQGRPLGGVQKFFYDPTLPPEHEKSLASQLTKSNIHVRRMANERKIQEVVNSVKQVASGYKEPHFLTTDQHPEAAALNEITRNTIAIGMQSAMNAFRQAHPEFVFGEANATAMVAWVEKSGRSPVDAQSWELAWAALKPYIAAEPAPIVAQVPAPAPTPGPAAAPVAAVPAVRHASGVPTGLSNADVFNEEPIALAPKVQGVRVVIDGKTQVVDLRTWDRIPSDVQKRALRNSSNASAIDALYRAEDERKAAARSGR
jgi:hypothetical protein